MKSISESLKQLGSVKEGFLVLAILLMPLGYLVTAYEARKYALGPLPLLDAQYLIAGALPALVVYITWRFTAFGWNLIPNATYSSVFAYAKLAYLVSGALALFYLCSVSVAGSHIDGMQHDPFEILVGPNYMFAVVQFVSGLFTDNLLIKIAAWGALTFIATNVFGWFLVLQ